MKNMIGVHTLDTSKLGFGLDKLAKKAILHVKANKTVYMQVGKVVVYGIITATGLMVTNTSVLASTLEVANEKAGMTYYQVVALCSWGIILKACWDMAVACINGEVRKAPSIGLSYLIVAVVIYAMPMMMNMIKDLFVF